MKSPASLPVIFKLLVERGTIKSNLNKRKNYEIFIRFNDSIFDQWRGECPKH